MKRRAGFTLVEILVVLAIIAILAALLFPAFKSAQEKGYQASCASTLHQIGMAVQMYKTEEGRYPSSLAFLLPEDANLNDTSSATPVPTPNSNGTGLLKLTQAALICPDDDTESSLPRSSYGDISTNINSLPNTDMGRYVWNYWGYKTDGTAYVSAAAAAAGSTQALLTDTNNPYNEASVTGYNPANPFNGIKYSMSNRFAPPSTIVTHCIYHRMPTSDLARPELVYDPDPLVAATGKDARDLILRLDGSAKSYAIAQFNTGSWQTQNF
jgi:prepilin-type N-terminal cleavage/methylation domain-containing protein